MDERGFGLELNRTTTQKQINAHTMHSHEDHELFFLLSGQRRYFLGHGIYDIAPGNAIFIPRTMLHRTVSLGSKGFDRYVLNFSQKHYDAFMEMAGWDAGEIFASGVCLQLEPDAVRQMQKAFDKLMEELRSPGKWSQAAATHLFYEILLTCLRQGTPKAPYSEQGADRIQQVTKYISHSYAQWITLEDAASMAHMEKTYFCKRFKALVGCGFLEYLTQTRLQNAKKLLETTDASIGEVAEACGFSGGNYFGDVFLRECGLSPTQYRKNRRQEA